VIEAVAFAVAAVVIASLAYSFGVRYLAHRAATLAEVSRMDKLEAALATHKSTHEKAIANLVLEMRKEIGEVRTKASLAMDKAQSGRRRFG